MKFTYEDDEFIIMVKVKVVSPAGDGCYKTLYIIKYFDDEKNEICIYEEMMPRFIELCNLKRISGAKFMKFSCEDDEFIMMVEVETLAGNETWYTIKYHDDDENEIIINEKMMPRFIELCNQARNYVLECKKESEKPALWQQKCIRDNDDQ